MASQLPDDRPPSMTPPAGGGMVGRIQRIIIQPKDEFARIDVEPSSAARVFRTWAVPLAAIGPAAGFIGQQVFGFSLFGVTYRPPLVGSLASAVLGYLAALAGVWVLTLVIEALAPTFGAVKNRDQAMKVAAYSYTAAWVAGVLQVIPMLGLIAALLALYSFYLLWVGLPLLMKAPADKAVGYVVVSIVVSIVVYVIVGAIVTTLSASIMRPTLGTGGSGTVSLGSIAGADGTSLNLDKLAAAGQQMAAAAEKTAAAGTTNVTINNGKIADPAALQAMLPTSIAGFTRTEVESAGAGAGGLGGATAKGTYAQGDQRFELSVTDVGALGNLATLGGALNVNSSKQTATGYEKTSMEGGNMVEESWDTSDHRGKYSTLVGSRFAVAAEGSAPTIDPLKAAVGAIDLGKLTALAK